MGYHHLSDEAIQEVLAVYHETQSVAETAARLGLGQQRVRYWLKKHGIRPSGQRDGAVRRNKDLILSMVQEDKSQSEIARTIHANRRDIRAFLQEQGLDPGYFDQSGANNPNWRGGRLIDKDGYVLLHRPDHPNCNRHGYVREHRLVVEQAIGRYLDSVEVVHHLDNDAQNNVLSNLKLYPSNADHLGETLAGHVPEWTEEGLRRIREGVLRSVKRRQKSTRVPS